jgi:hypothetical protein
MKLLLVLFITTLTVVAHANTAAELRELNRRQRQVSPWLTIRYAGPVANAYRVHYSLRGSGRDITVLAESTSEARRVVMDDREV